MSRFPTRGECIDRLADLINSDILAEELVEVLSDIVKIIDAERMGFDIWGARFNSVNEIWISPGCDFLEPSPEEIAEAKKHQAKLIEIAEKYGVKFSSCYYDDEEECFVEREE